MSMELNVTSRPMTGRPTPRTSLITSLAWSVPMIPGSTPTTPPSAQLGTLPGSGGSGYMHR
jgi:hypothetical protein